MAEKLKEFEKGDLVRAEGNPHGGILEIMAIFDSEQGSRGILYILSLPGQNIMEDVATRDQIELVPRA